MYKTMVLIKKKTGMSMEDFIAHYEGTHAPLAARAMPTLQKYVRYFLRPVGDDPRATGDAQSVHVVTEMWYEDKAAFDAAMAALAEPETAALINADGESLFDLSSIRFTVVESHETDLHSRPP